MRKFVSLVAVLLVVCFLAASPSMAADRVGTRVGPARNLEWSRTEVPSGGLEDVTLSDGATLCCRFDGCTPPPDPDFNVGDTLTIDSYWEETIPDSANWVVEFSAGLKPQGRPVIVLFNRVPVSFGPLAAGSYTFCLSYDVGPVPAAAAGRQNTATGFGVETAGGTLPPAPYQTFDVNP